MCIRDSHGTDDSVLQVGAGHLPGTALPVGGENTHCVLAAHRGLPSARLFSDIDQLEEGDMIYLHILGEVHAYRVENILPMVPKDDFETLNKALRILHGQDWLSLMTCTPYGIKCAEKLGYELTQQGGMVVSGMAKGVDGAAMRGALRFGGFTCGVLGGGVDVVYPAENRRLYEDIAATGVLLSEYPPQTLPEAWHFPVRNRIISGLSVAAVVVEAPVKSGALITAENAMEQGRDVFAIPGPVDAPNSAGCHRLIREGAILATCAWDILGEYESRFPHKLRRAAPPMPPLPRLAGEPKLAAEKPKTNASRPEEAEVPALPCLTAEELAGLSDEQRTVLRALRTDAPLLTDQLAEDSGLPIQRVLPALTLLEISGWAAQNGARSFVRTVALPEE